MLRRYAAALDGRLPEELPSPPSYAEFVEAEREQVASAESERFWRERMGGATTCTLPWILYGRSAETALEPRLAAASISPETSRGLWQLARKARVPIRSVLLAAHLHVLQALTGQSDVITGVVTNGRSTADGGLGLGLFLNTVPFRQAAPADSWVDLAQRTFALELELLPHRRYPLIEIQRQHGGSLFDTIFNFTHFPCLRTAAESREAADSGSGRVRADQPRLDGELLGLAWASGESSSA